ncbi:TetR/AcrR family transcriptional regulator [Paenibacillus sp. FSL R5-0517]|uniref:TetR/AcrR family transcriptional regulator n=1 Tax=Paenibacillus sp. FSL R5-0517 TaxID=2921647 RepID=UPI0030DC97B5
MKNKQYLIADARKEQIINSAIEVLNENGYFSTSLSKIAKKANISTGLISYHFSSKEDLMNNTLLYLVQHEQAFIKDKVEIKETYLEKLKAFIEAGVAYRATKRENTMALLEIAFNVRTPENIPYFRVEMSPEDELNIFLEDILSKGQDSKEFKDFNTQVVAMIIRGAISLSMSLPQKTILLSFEDYTEEVKENILKLVR